jgi:hypothetical protein
MEKKDKHFSLPNRLLFMLASVKKVFFSRQNYFFSRWNYFFVTLQRPA